MTIIQDATGATLITGPVADQAALHGLLRKVRDLGLMLLALSLSEPINEPDQYRSGKGDT